MLSREGVGGQDALSVHSSEMEVENNPPEVERGRMEAAGSRPLSQENQKEEVPFKTAKGFGNWLYDVLDAKTYEIVLLNLARFCRTFRMKSLVRCAKRRFRDMKRLYFLQGLHIIAVSKKQKDCIKKIFQKERKKIEANKAMIPAPR